MWLILGSPWQDRQRTADSQTPPSPATLLDTPRQEPMGNPSQLPDDIEEKKQDPRNSSVQPPARPSTVPAKASAAAHRGLDQSMPPPGGISQGAIDRRIRRALEPNARGDYKVSEEVRKMWNDGKRDAVFRLFAQCGNDTETFIKKHAVKKEQEREFEVGVFFKFQTEDQMADLTETLCCNKKHKFNVNVFDLCLWSRVSRSHWL